MKYVAKELPDLRRASRIAIDVETHDPDLLSTGAGWALGKGKLIGISVASDITEPVYIPLVEHYGTGFPIELLRLWAKRNLCTSATIVGANLMYDIGWLHYVGIETTAPYYDVQWAAALIDEHRTSYSLSSLAKDVVGDDKTTETYVAWVAATYGKRATTKNKLYSYLHAAPLDIIAEYAAQDAMLPLCIMAAQLPTIEREGLGYVLQLEHDLIPLLLDMKRIGVRIDMDKLSQARNQVSKLRIAAQHRLDTAARGEVNVNSAADLAKLFDAHNVPYGTTDKGNPSFAEDVLKTVEHQLAKDVLEVKRWNKVEGTFLDGYMSKVVNGRLHTDFNPLRRDGAGTVSGRFSSTNPNLQNIPSRDPVTGKLLRSLFIPEEGCLWGANDWSQVEYRIMLCFANGAAAEAARRRFISDPKLDFHQAVADMCGIARTPAKTINFGILYGMSVPKLMQALGVSEEEAASIMETYHKRAPYVSALMSATKRKASIHKHVTSLSGRRHRFTRWALFGVPKLFDTIDEARLYAREHNVRSSPTPAGIHTALNRLIQGSAADVLKEAMRKAYTDGVFNVLSLHLTVHDEFGTSVPCTKEGREAFSHLQHIMEHIGADVYDLEVPLLVDGSTGRNWAEAK